MPLRPATPETIADAAAVLRAGGLIGLPTETVYGLAADATNPAAVAAVFAAKGRPAFNPLIAHVLDGAAAARHARLDARAWALIEAFWPGPLTLVAPRLPQSPIAELACAGLASIAVRAPGHPVARAIIATAGAPLAAPSANRSGRLSPTTAQAVAAEMGEGLLVVDGGPCTQGLESTIVALPEDGPAALLRPGALPRGAIEALIGPLAAVTAHAAPQAPGQLASHYAPRAALRLDALAPVPGEAFLGFGPVSAPGHPTLSATGDLQEAAAALYAALRALDEAGAAAIAVAPIPADGLGEAIRDRLRRAAAPRPLVS